MYVDKQHIRVYVCSDLHADTQRNQDWVRANCVRAPEHQHEQDIYSVFILPGDIGTELDRLSAIFEILTNNYDAVVYCIGNHECWRRGTASGGSSLSPEKRNPNTNRLAENSVLKIVEVIQCAKSHGVYCGPVRIESTTASGGNLHPSSLVVIPLQSWYHSGWDTEQNITDPAFLQVQEVMPFERKWGDFHQCTWPGLCHEQFASIEKNDMSLSQAFADLNEPFLYPKTDQNPASSAETEFTGNAELNSPFRKGRINVGDDKGHNSDGLVMGGKRYKFDDNGQLVVDEASTTSSPASSTASPPKKKPANAKEMVKLLHRFRSETTEGAESNRSSPRIEGTEEDTPREDLGGLRLTEEDYTENTMTSSSPIVKNYDTVISFSHFVPRQELMPEKRFLLEPHLTKVIGSDPLEEQIRRLQPHIHLFGHTHIPIDMELDGITYIQWPLGYFKESEKQCKPIYQNGPLLVHDSSLGRGKRGIPIRRPSLTTWWTKYYEEHSRDPTNEELSPWLINRLNEFAGLVNNAQLDRMKMKKESSSSNGGSGGNDSQVN